MAPRQPLFVRHIPPKVFLQHFFRLYNTFHTQAVSNKGVVQTLKDERCEASNVFVLRIREHYEAKTAVELLRIELKGMQAAGGVSLAQIDEMPSYNRLMAYTNMFKT